MPRPSSAGGGGGGGYSSEKKKKSESYEMSFLSGGKLAAVSCSFSGVRLSLGALKGREKVGNKLVPRE